MYILTLYFPNTLLESTFECLPNILYYGYDMFHHSSDVSLVDAIFLSLILRYTNNCNILHLSIFKLHLMLPSSDDSHSQGNSVT